MTEPKIPGTQSFSVLKRKRNQRKRGEKLPWDELTKAVQRRLFREKDPRVPPEFSYDVQRRVRRKKTWEELAPTVQHVLYRQKSPRVPKGWRPAPAPPRIKKERVLLPFSKLTRSHQLRLYKLGSPRVPPDFSPVKLQNSLKGVPWEELSPKQKYRLYRRKDPRVPEGFNPLLTPEERKARAKTRGGSEERPWEKLSLSYKTRLYRAGDPRVPTGWLPPLARKDLKPEVPFEHLPYSEQVKLYQRADPRVPKDFQLRVRPPKFKIRTEHDLEREFSKLKESRKLEMYRRGSSKVPASYIPPKGTTLLPFENLEMEKQHELYLASDERVPEDFVPSERLLQTMHARADFMEHGRERIGAAYYNEPRAPLLEGHEIGEIPEELQGLEGHELLLGIKQYLSRLEANHISDELQLASILEEAELS